MVTDTSARVSRMVRNWVTPERRLISINWPSTQMGFSRSTQFFVAAITTRNGCGRSAELARGMRAG